ncbi:MAG: LysE family translocator [Bauldia litoralis]
MSEHLLAGFVIFAVVTLFTPGPNNIMLMASGLNYGLRRAMPHLLGVAIGFAVMVLAVGIGLGAVFNAFPALYPVIKYVGVAYLLYLAWVVATAAPPDTEGGGKGQPITFLQASAFQWVNPKAWVMAVGAVATYAAIAAFPFNMAIIAGIFGAIGLVSAWAWVIFGQALRRLVRTRRAIRVFNIAMGLLLVASIVPVLVEDWL